MLMKLATREFVILALSTLVAAVAWTGVFGGVNLVISLIAGFCGGLLGALRAFFRWRLIKSQMPDYPDELGPPPAIAMSSTIGGMITFAAVVGLITWGIKVLL